MITRLNSLLILTMLICVGCASNSKTVGLINGTGQEMTIETRPNIRYNGGPEKFIGLEKDSSNRGLVWKFNNLIDCIIVYPKANNPERDSLGLYIMKPKSSFSIGWFYEPEHITYSAGCLNIDYLKITTGSDTLVMRTRQEIWNVLNRDKRTKGNRKVYYDKALYVSK